MKEKFMYSTPVIGNVHPMQTKIIGRKVKPAQKR